MPKKPKILKDIDEFALKRIEQATKSVEEKPEDYLPKCKNCGGAMEQIIPIVEMQFEKWTLELHECKNCQEREYI